MSTAWLPEGSIFSRKLSLKSLGLKFLDSLTWKQTCSRMDAANLVNDCFPEPETPINIEFPRGCIKILRIPMMCLIASSKKTKSILLLDAKL